jgi:hypothetical protein
VLYPVKSGKLGVMGGERLAVLCAELFPQIAITSDSASGQGRNDNLPGGYVKIIQTNYIYGKV